MSFNSTGDNVIVEDWWYLQYFKFKIIADVKACRVNTSLKMELKTMNSRTGMNPQTQSE